MITATCAISGKTFVVPFLASGSTYKAAPDAELLHPVFYLPTQTLLYISAGGCPPVDTSKDRDYAGLLLLALWHRTGLVTFSCPVFPSLKELTFYFNDARRTLLSVQHMNVRVSRIPKFHVTAETKDNFFGGFPKTLATYKDMLAAQETATALASEVNSLDRSTLRRELYGFKTISPAIAARVASLIEWEGADAEIATEILTANPATIVARVNTDETLLPDLANLLLDVELLDWQGPTKAMVLEHLRGIANCIYTLRGLTNDEKEMFTDVVEKTGGLLDIFSDEAPIKIVQEEKSTTATPSASWAHKLEEASKAQLPKTFGSIRLPTLQTSGRAALDAIFSKRGIVK